MMGLRKARCSISLRLKNMCRQITCCATLIRSLICQKLVRHPTDRTGTPTIDPEARKPVTRLAFGFCRHQHIGDRFRAFLYPPESPMPLESGLLPQKS